MSASVGTTVASCAASGCIFFSLSFVTQPDPGIDPFTTGTIWALVNTASDYLGNVYAVAQAGRYAISSAGVVMVAGTLAAGVDTICVQATAPSGAVCQGLFYVVVS